MQGDNTLFSYCLLQNLDCGLILRTTLVWQAVLICTPDLYILFLAKNKKSMLKFNLKIAIFIAVKTRCILLYRGLGELHDDITKMTLIVFGQIGLAGQTVHTQIRLLLEAQSD